MALMTGNKIFKWWRQTVVNELLLVLSFSMIVVLLHRDLQIDGLKQEIELLRAEIEKIKAEVRRRKALKRWLTVATVKHNSSQRQGRTVDTVVIVTHKVEKWVFSFITDRLCYTKFNWNFILANTAIRIDMGKRGWEDETYKWIPNVYHENALVLHWELGSQRVSPQSLNLVYFSRQTSKNEKMGTFRNKLLGFAWSVKTFMSE